MPDGRSCRGLCSLLIVLLLSGCYALQAPIVTPDNAQMLPGLAGRYELRDAGDLQASLDLAVLDGGPGYRFVYRERGEEDRGVLRLTPGRDGVLLAQIDVVDEGLFLYFARVAAARITILSSDLDETGERALAAAHGIELVERARYGPVTPIGDAGRVLAFLQAVSAGPLKKAADGVLVKVSP